MTTKFLLHDITNLPASVAKAWVAGWVNGNSAAFQVLQANGTFAGTMPSTVPFYAVSAIREVTLDAATNGNNRLLFVVSPTQPAPLTTVMPAPPSPQYPTPVAYTQYPYPVQPGVAAPGPFDVFEFGMNAQDDVSAVSGFGLNLSFELHRGLSQQYGVLRTVKRRDIATAYKAFIAKEATAYAPAQAFKKLLYDGPIDMPGAPTPPAIAGQFFGISDPNDMVDALTQNYAKRTSDPLAIYWNLALTSFFQKGNYLSINLGFKPGTTTPNTYSGTCGGTPGALAYTLSNGQNTYIFPSPLNANLNPLGLAGSQYVFGQIYGPLTPAGSGGDAGTLQDNIWMAFCRGVAQSGVFSRQVTNGESTTAWNDWKKWYPPGGPCDFYAKFLHCAALDGSDSRTSGQPSIFYGGAAYGFGEDEAPAGLYTGPNVPSKTPHNVPDGSVLTIYVGPWQ